MSVPHYSRFLAECIVKAPDELPGLLEDEVYGVYVSWCFLNGERPGSHRALWDAMGHLGHDKDRSSSPRYFGLAMTGPAALNYILSSQPSLI